MVEVTVKMVTGFEPLQPVSLVTQDGSDDPCLAQALPD
jgi:hypothetical protein